MKEICSKCRPERICKNTNGGRLLIQNDDTVLQLHVPIEECPIYKEPTQEEEGLEESIKWYHPPGRPDLLMKL